MRSASEAAFTPEQNHIIMLVVMSGAGLSLIGGLFIILSYIWYRSLRNFPYKLIVILTIADVLNSGAYLMGFDHRLCQAQAALMQFFTVATFLWTGTFALNVYMVLVRHKSDVAAREPLYHLLCWGLSGLSLGVNLGLGSLDTTFERGELWCWIGGSYSWARLATFYAPLLLVLVLNLLFYVRIYFAMRLRPDMAHVHLNSRLALYLSVFFCVRVWGLVNRAQNYVSPQQPIFSLYLMHAIFSPLQGFFNALVYGLNQSVRQHFQQVCCSSRPEVETSVTTAWPELYLDSGASRASSMMEEEDEISSSILQHYKALAGPSPGPPPHLGTVGTGRSGSEDRLPHGGPHGSVFGSEESLLPNPNFKEWQKRGSF